MPTFRHLTAQILTTGDSSKPQPFTEYAAMIPGEKRLARGVVKPVASCFIESRTGQQYCVDIERGNVPITDSTGKICDLSIEVFIDGVDPADKVIGLQASEKRTTVRGKAVPSADLNRSIDMGWRFKEVTPGVANMVAGLNYLKVGDEEKEQASGNKRKSTKRISPSQIERNNEMAVGKIEVAVYRTRLGVLEDSPWKPEQASPAMGPAEADDDDITHVTE
jgi:hypothetical protein